MTGIERYLLQVEKPARYTGGELNSIVKDKSRVKIRYAFCFPDIYEIGMSHLGLKCIYHVLNNRPEIWCERSFMPWIDMEQVLRENNLPLFALESGDPLSAFDFLGFTLQYEMSYTNLLAMLDLAKIPLFSKDRESHHPIVMAGGPCAVNPEPMADFVDLFVIGEGEEVIVELMDLYQSLGKNRMDFLKAAAKVKGVYVPQFYEVSYHEDGTIQERKALGDAPKTVQKRVVENLDALEHPEKIIVPYTEVVHDRVTLEIFRGCIRGCRFCQAGFIYRPVRERSPESLVKIAKDSLEATGYSEVSLCSLSTSDYQNLASLTDQLMEYTTQRKINFCLPSLRIDNFDFELASKVQAIRKSSLTFAPEAGSQRMRDVINKNVKEEDILATAKMVFQNGWSSMKLYFMIGLPYETMEDVLAIKDLAYLVQDEYYAIDKPMRPKGARITVSTSSFVPKPFTPFMWAPQDTKEMLMEKQRSLKAEMKSKLITYNYHDADLSIMEGVFARGDRKLSKVILSAYQKGCRLDGWSEHFKLNLWMEAFLENGIDYTFYNHRERSYEEILPWDFIDVGVSKNFLMRENEKAKMAATTPNCREQCSGCGITKLVRCEDMEHGIKNPVQ